MSGENSYLCESMFLDSPFSFSIDEEFYHNTKNAKSRLVSRIRIHHVIEQTITAYKEFEIFLASSAIDEYIDNRFIKNDYFEVSNLANLRFVNLLNSILRSKDQIKKIISTSYDQSIKIEFGKIWKNKISESLEFAFLRYVRNTAQHIAPVVEGRGFETAWDESRSLRESRIILTFKFDDIISHQRKISVEDREKFSAHFEDRIDIPYFARKSSSDFFSIYNDLSILLDQYKDSDLSLFEEAIEHIRDQTGGKSSALMVKYINDKKTEEIQLFPEFLNRVDYSNKRLPTRLENHYVSTRPSKHAPVKAD